MYECMSVCMYLRGLCHYWRVGRCPVCREGGRIYTDLVSAVTDVLDAATIVPSRMMWTETDIVLATT